MRTLCVKLYDWLHEELEEYAKLKGLSKSEVVRKALEEYLKRHREDIHVEPKVIRILG